MNTEGSTRKVVLSIIIPVYNVEAYIRQCLDSIFTEENAALPYEVIVVNDGTPDKSMDIVEEYVTKHQNLHVVRQENQGLSVARNTGMTLAQGEYVWFVDSDDWIEPYAINTLLFLIEQHPDIDIFTVPVTWKYENPNQDWVNLRVKENTVITGKEYQEAGYHIGAWMFVTKRSFIVMSGIKFYPGILHEDGLWTFEILYLSGKVMVLANPCYCYRQRSNSIMSNVSIKSGYDIITVHQELMKFMKTYVRKEDRAWFQKMHILQIQDATYVVWHLRHTKDFKRFLADTRDYRNRVCDECAQLGGLMWKLKCHIMKYPVLNEYLRIMKKNIKRCL